MKRIQEPLDESRRGKRKSKKKKETNKQQLSMSSKEEADIHTNKDINDDE